MLNCTTDRLDYGALLAPPTGYELEQAVIATYSLDPTVLLAIPVAISFAESLDEAPHERAFETLEAVRRCMGKIVVFCQKGRIHVPDEFSALYSWIEDSIVQVQLGAANRSFHPKLCVLRYERADNPVRYRVIVLSRNLTTDRNWDIAAHADGEVGEDYIADNTPLSDFVSYLGDFVPGIIPTAFTTDLNKVEFNKIPGFNPRVRFHPIGIPGYEQSPISRQSGPSAIVVSPFLDAICLKVIRSKLEGDGTLLSRREELDKMPAEALDGFSCYALSELVVDGERRDDEDDDTGFKKTQNLHAKLFIYQMRGWSKWFLGSANATSRAFGRVPGSSADDEDALRNVEFLLELHGSSQEIQADAMLRELLDAETGVFEPYDPTMSTDEEDPHEAAQTARKLQEFEFALLQQSVFVGQLEHSPETGGYDLTIDADLAGISSSIFSVDLAPFNVDADAESLSLGTRQTIQFRGIPLVAISRFVRITIRNEDATLRSFLLKLNLNGLPEERADAVLKSIVSNADAFLRYLGFLLADDKRMIHGDGWLVDKNKGGLSAIFGGDQPIFESLLKTAARSPELLATIGDLIERLNDEVDADGSSIVPPDFRDLWTAFEQFVPQGGARG